MFARWSQENFFKYMHEHYGLDKLVGYTLAKIPESTKVVNPQYREVDSEARKAISQLSRKQCECNEVLLKEDIVPEKVEEYEVKKVSLLEEVDGLQKTVGDLKALRKATPLHVQIGDLPKEDRFKQLNMWKFSPGLLGEIRLIERRFGVYSSA